MPGDGIQTFRVRTQGVIMKRGFARLFILLFSAVSLLLGISSCGFVGALFGSGGDDGTGTSDFYTLTINYNYWGTTATVSVNSPIVFWIMPLDENGNIIDDTSSPDGGPTREVEEAYIQKGSLSITLATGTYAILAFHDSINKNAMPDLREPYVLYNDRYFADSTVTPYTDSNGTDQYFVNPHWDTITLSDHDENIYIGFGNEGQKYEWHAVYIAKPDDGDYLDDGNYIKNKFFDVVGGFFDGSGIILEIKIDGITVSGSFNINSDTKVWYKGIDASDFTDGLHTLTVNLFYQDGGSDTYSVSFREANGAYAYIDYSFYNSSWSVDFSVWGGFDTDAVKYIRIQIDSGPLQDAGTIDFSNGYWDYFVSVTSLVTGIHTLTVYAVDQYNNLLSTYQIPFNR